MRVPSGMCHIAFGDSISGEELCKTAEDNGIDLHAFVIE